MYDCTGYGINHPKAKFAECKFQRGIYGPDDIEIDIKYCGICRSDVHRWSREEITDISMYPMVPGHEVSGIAKHVGANVKDIKVGDPVGVGVFVDCCGSCDSCNEGDEQMCELGVTPTYAGKIKHGGLKTSTGWTYGGYSDSITVQRKFVFKIAPEYPLHKAGPVFCSAITMYTPLKYFGAIRGAMTVGIAGLGGLGLMGVKLAKKMGCKVVVFSTSENKKDRAMEIGADVFVNVTSPDEVKQHLKSVNLLISTVAVPHDLNVYLGFIKNKGTLVQVGLVSKPFPLEQMKLFNRVSITGSMVGNVSDTQEVMDFCLKHGIESEVQLIRSDELDRVFELLEAKNDDVVRYVLDIEASNMKATK